MNDDLITWLRWVLDQREAEARLLCALAGVTDTGTWLRNLLAEVDAKRRILDLHAADVERVDTPSFNPLTGERISDDYEVNCAVCGWATSDPTSACTTVRLLALPHADRPGYREDWRP